MKYFVIQPSAIQVMADQPVAFLIPLDQWQQPIQILNLCGNPCAIGIVVPSLPAPLFIMTLPHEQTFIFN